MKTYHCQTCSWDLCDECIDKRGQSSWGTTQSFYNNPAKCAKGHICKLYPKGGAYFSGGFMCN